MNFPFLAFALLIVAIVPVSAEENRIRLERIDGRTRLVNPDGRPFFAHGVTHIGSKHGEDVLEIGRACVAWGEAGPVGVWASG
ncbi:MAG: hypothetical protein ACR2RV_24650 [Verrucomicrobiales bacterium]